MILKLFKVACLLYVINCCVGCGDIKKLQYLQGSFDTAQVASYAVAEPVIQKNDLLGITVFSDNPKASAIYNQPSAASTSVPGLAEESMPVGTTGARGYLVDQNGNIQFQGLGDLHVEGMTKKQVAGLLDDSLAKYLQNPYYDIRFLNYKITIIGDVAKPSVYSIPSERVTILEALGLAGDLNVTARRDNLLIIREQNGKREFGRIDLTKPDIFNSPYFQLKQNDVVYVDLTRNKAAQNSQATVRNVTLATSILSTVALFITVFRR